MTLNEAEQLARATDYAIESEAVAHATPINWADAAAFFLEGYEFRAAQRHGKVRNEIQTTNIKSRK